MGSNLSQQMCCVACEWCRRQEVGEGNEETSETKPILQSSGDTPMFTDTQPPTPALKVPKQGSKEVQFLSQARWPSVHTLEENMETCSAADAMGRDEGWEAAWNPMDFFVAPADEEVEAGLKDLTQADHQQEKVGYPEEKIQPVCCVPEAHPVGDTAQDEQQPKDQAEPGSDSALCAGITHLERNILSLIETGSESAPCPGCEMEPRADTGEVLTGRDLFLCAGQVAEGTEPYLSAEHGEGMDRAEITPQAAKAELTCLVEALSVLTVQDSSEVLASGVEGLYSTSAVPWVPLCPERGSLEPANQLPDCSLQQESQPCVPPAQGMESLHCAEPAGPGELLAQPSHGVLSELEDKRSRKCEAEPQSGIVQQTAELPEEPETCVPVPTKQEAEFPNVSLLLPEVLGSSGKIEDENVEA